MNGFAALPHSYIGNPRERRGLGVQTSDLVLGHREPGLGTSGQFQRRVELAPRDSEGSEKRENPIHVSSNTRALTEPE